MKKVSVIIPVYNTENYLEKCLDSIVNQTLKEIEVIAVNDGSTDKSGEILREYEKRYSNFHVIEQENKGVVEARITGLMYATGDYIGWCDSDDFCDLNMFKILYESAVENDADVVSCNYNFYPGKIGTKEKWFKEYKGSVDWQFIERNTIQTNKIVKKDLLDSIDIIKLFRYVGEACYENVLIKAKKIVTINQCLYYYRVGQKSLSTDRSNYKWYLKHIEKNYNQLRIIEEGDYDQKYHDYFKYRVYYAIILALIILAYNGKKELYQTLKKEIRKYNRNRLNKIILNYNFGILKGEFMRLIVPHSFFMTRMAAKIAL